MKKLVFLISAFIFFSTTSHAQSERFSKNQFIQNGDTLNYRMLFPDNDPLIKYPLIIFLHGAGERGSDNEAQLKWGVQNFAADKMMMEHPAIIIAPQCPLTSTWSSFKKDSNSFSFPMLTEPTKPMQLVIALIRQALSKYPIDTNRIYITGLSMGGLGTFDIIERYPNLFAAAVTVCGGGDISKTNEISHIPLWMFHGANDPVVNPQFSMNMAMALMKVGGHPALTIYPETGHFSWLGAYSDEHMMEWLFRQHK